MDLIALKGAIDGIVYIKGALTTLINEKNEMAVRERALDILKSVDSVQAGLFDARHYSLIQRLKVENELRM